MPLNPAPVRDNFTLPIGSDFSRAYTYSDDDDQPLDLTGCTARMQFFASYLRTGEPLLELTSGEEGTITLGDGDRNIQVDIPGAMTLDLPRHASGVLATYFDLLVIFPEPDAARKRVVMGRCDLSMDCTR